MPPRIIVVLAALLLSACTPTHIPTDQQFREVQPEIHNNWHVPDGEAIVVMGVEMVQPLAPAPPTLFGMGSPAFPPIYIGWIAIDPATGLATKPYRMVRTDAGAISGHAHEGKMEYFVYTLPPGNYALAWLRRGMEADYFNAAFQTVEIVQITAGSRRGELLQFGGPARVKTNAPSFVLKPNEVLYVGDLVFDARSGNALTWTQERNDTAAKEALADRGGTLPGKMTVRLLRHLDGAAITAADSAPVTLHQ